MKPLSEAFKGRDLTRPAAPEEPHPFEAAVHKTSKLIGRSYMATYAMVKNWPLHKIERRYKEAINCNRELTTPAIRWWSLRKQEQAAGPQPRE